MDALGGFLENRLELYHEIHQINEKTSENEPSEEGKANICADEHRERIISHYLFFSYFFV